MKNLFLCTVAVFAVVTGTIAQSNTGRIVGTVADAGGVIAGATVVVTDNKTKRERTVVSSDDGTFTVPQLEFGNYNVRVTAAGRKAFTAQDVKIDVGREYSLNILMEVGDVNAEVTIVAGEDLINASNAQLSNSVSPKQIQDLPLNGRNPLDLITLQAGTASNGSQGTSINGQRPSAPNITLDGLNIQDNFIRSNASSFTQIATTVDDISEFTITTQNAGADQGNGSAQIQLVTPRGQSDFHGALYAYNRNSEFSANNFFNNAAGIERGYRNFNQFGGRVSGPMPIFNFGEGGPMFLKDKGFFFFNYEGLRDIFPFSSTRAVLTDPARQGIFSYVDNAGVNRSVNLFNLPIGGVNPPTGINPIIQSRYLNNIPRGNAISVGDQLNTTGYQFIQRETDKDNQIKMRFDVDINDKNTFNVVYLYSNSDNLIADFGDSNGFSSTPASGQTDKSQFIVGAYRWTPLPTFTNEIRAGYTSSKPTFVRTGETPPNLFVGATTGALPLSVTNPETTFLNQGRNTKTYTFQDNADYSRGNHSMRFGVQYNVFRALRLNSGSVLPEYTLGVNLNTPQITPEQFNNEALFPGGINVTSRAQANALYAFLGGIISRQDQTFNVLTADSGFVPFEGFRQDYAYENLGAYFSDQWRLRPNFTVNLGLRYELWFPVRERNGVITEVAIPDGTNPVDALLNPNGFLQVVGGNTGNGSLFKMDKNNFSPNVSVAWSPDFNNGFLSSILPGGGRTVLRGGFRISYFNDEFLKASSGEGDQNPGLRLSLNRVNLNERVGSQGGIATPTVQIPLSFAAQNARFNNFGSVAAVDPDLQVPQNYEYNVGIQRSIGWNMALEARYVGAFSSNSTRYSNKNQIDITGNGFLADFLRARSNLFLTGNPGCTTAQNAGCQTLTVFPNLGSGGLLTNATIRTLINDGLPGQLALTYLQNNLQGSVNFRQNPNIGAGILLSNTGRYNYNGLQLELRRGFSQGFSFQANYTFQKTLTNTPGTDQRRFEFELDATRPELEYSRAQYDQTHVFNFNSVYELPFGKGKSFLSNGGWVNALVGGWQLNSIVRLASGSPFSIFDPRGVLNYTSLSTRNPANTSLSKEEIKNLVGIFKNERGVFFINPAVIDPSTGRGANGINSAPFAGQVFFNVPPGQVGNVERFVLNGPVFFNVDASLFKNFRFTENTRVQLRAEAFNLFNRTNFGISATQQLQSINSPNFGRLTAAFSPRIMQFAARFEF